ncbi:alpha subunit of ribonucleoside diphosphate reductase [Earliella scabrosa]|nr:alpha subunit of ribonucleoside diphosphate reductase [Earliella scabrosa]
MHIASTIANFSSRHPAYLLLAGRVYIADIHKSVGRSFGEWILANGKHCVYIHPPTAVESHPHLSPAHLANLDPHLVKIVRENYAALDAAIQHPRDFALTYPAIQTLVRSYLIRIDAERVERPQYMYMRNAITINGGDIPKVIETYEALSKHLYTHASPTLFNAGTRSAFYSSCYITQPDAQSPRTLLRSVGDLDAYWMADGGVGTTLGAVPCRRHVRLTSPTRQPGVMPLLRVYDSHAHYCILSRDRRPSALTVYLPMWHGDIRSFVLCRTSRASSDDRVRHVFPALWIPDIYMQRLRDNADWLLFDPVDVPDLVDAYGDRFSDLYEHYAQTVVPMATVPSAELWRSICEAQTETGGPFLMFQDNINRRNVQRHLGVVKSSNLCTEIVQVSSPSEPAVCTLASVALPRFIRCDGTYDFDMLHLVTKLAVRNTDILLDTAKFPVGAAATSVNRTRPIGIGVQGLADVFMILGIPYGSSAAKDINIDIFETVYHAALEASCELAKTKGPYPAWAGSLASEGILHSDMWPISLRNRYDFVELRNEIVKHGLRNSVLTAQMPTASTSHLLGNSEGVEPYSSNLVTYQLLSGDYTQICPWLVRDLATRGLWNDDIRSDILRNHGSVQGLTRIPPDVQEIYRTAWEIDPTTIIDMAADRAPYIDQSQSMSLSIAAPTTPLLTNLQRLEWERGLKTGVYYLRTTAPSYPITYGLSPNAGEADTADDDSDDLPPPLEDVTQDDAPSVDCCGS